MATYGVGANRKDGSVRIVNSDMPGQYQEWYFYAKRVPALIKALQEAEKFLEVEPQEKFWMEV